MAPIRRYLRITKYSVLECRIYLDNPALAETWLLNPRDPILPRVIQSVRPLVLPKLREENERSHKKGKKKGVKDVVIEEEFEVSIFLTEISTRHSILTKQKHFRDINKKGMQSNSSKLTGATNDTAIEIEDAAVAGTAENEEDVPIIQREESEEDVVNLDELPDADVDADSVADSNTSEDSLFVAEDEEPSRSKRPRASTDTNPSSKRRKGKDKEVVPPEEPSDDKKKLTMDTSYDGFSIYGRVLCLVVKRRDRKGKGPANSIPGQAQIEDWITSTQMPAQEDD